MTRSPRGPRALTIQITALMLLALPLWAASASAGDGDDDEVKRHRIHDRQVWVLDDEGEAHQVQPLGGGGFLGVETVPLTPELRAHFGTPEDSGVMISRLSADGPAARAGLAVGDVLTRFEDEAIAGRWDLLRAVRSREAETQVTVEVWRDGRPLDFTVTLGGTERTALDLAPMFRWHSDPMESRPGLHLEGRLGPLARPEMMEELRERLESMDWEGFTTRIEPHSEELEERLEELEKRLKELESELGEGGGRR